MKQRWSGRSRRPPSRGLLRKLADYGLTALLLFLLIVLVARLDDVNERSEQGHAIVNDGDSITLGSTRVRLRGIDAPEYSQLCTKDGADYACGKLAREALVRLAAGKAVSCTGW